MGSPPRVRVKLDPFSFQILNSGITPARAGKTLLALHSSRLDWDHPRACG